ncbi:hypothetical protein [Pseudoduganella violacea]|uniref:Phosphotransferase n=1 Tax=Pseudoduganella violacea TaxID=1715466 RepID=A0A7W5B7U9_9BURK|nr:hypothetical protein [Pseudoduganella violacea]MBB3118046.1 hypothetical protein [Pseudoduganella violacea]
MSEPHPNLFLVVDDREFSTEEVRSLVGQRRFGDIIFQRRTLFEHFRASLPQWAQQRLLRLRSAEDLPPLRAALAASGEDCAICIIAGRAGFAQPERLRQLIERLPYAEEDFTDRLYQPLLAFLHNGHALVADWAAFEAAPLHRWERAWHGSQRVQALEALDLGLIRDLLSFTTGATAARHFNQVQADNYYYTKSSADCRKLEAEYRFYQLVPEAMQPWLVQPFDYREQAGRASYRMQRFYLADAALQWVHDAFDAASFTAFIERLLFFLAQRPRRDCGKAQSAAAARALFVDKLEQRASQFLAMDEGRRINALVQSSTPELALERQLERFRRLYARHEAGFALEQMAIGHGDPCFSNVLYDQSRYLLKLIDPKGALSEEELWTHPFYDLCKVSHSVLGDYDFINNGLYQVSFADDNRLVLQLRQGQHAPLKALFRQQLRAQGYDARLLRLGEASLFLSMLPLHIDIPNKIVAFLLKAHAILDEVESD